MANLAALCPFCHRQHHRGLLGIVGDANRPDGLTFTDANGRVIDPATRPIKPTGPPPAPHRPYRHPTGERLEPRWLWFPSGPANVA